MAHSKPDTLDNRGDARRLADAVGAFVIELLRDERVNRAYERWHQERGLRDDVITKAVMRDRSLKDSIPRMVERYLDLELESMKRFVSEGLKLDYWWLAQPLIDAFEVRVHNDEHPEAPREFKIPVFVPTDAPKGRWPRNNGDDVVRNVCWFYRVHVKEPKDTISDLEREYAQQAQRHTDARSVVQNGIDQAQALLALVPAPPAPDIAARLRLLLNVDANDTKH